MHRRDFLRPRRLAQTAGHVLGALDELAALAEPEPQPADDVALLRVGRRAMATQFEVVLPYGTPDALEIAAAAHDLIDQLEAQLTVYRDDSEVSRLNRLAPLGPVPVERGLFDLLATAARLTGETGGAFDVAAGALVKAWGFYRGPRRVPAAEELAAAMAKAGMRHVELNPDARTVKFRVPGLEINLGSIGKGYALDRVNDLLGAWNLPAALLHGGYSSVYARGSLPNEANGWPVTIAHPWEPGRRLARLWLRDRALGTSAATFQHLEHEGRKLGHVLDPRTGWPASGVASASVVAPTGAEADALSTAFFVLGVEAARRYCETHPGVGAVLLPEGEDLPVVMGLTRDECDLSPLAPGAGERGRG
ncbi:MAG TPA: FAD:protein FMN transferase [Gemmataceae bacterium]|nr:FAD:protein FMN transferase [Gemmataceae bacterium]